MRIFGKEIVDSLSSEAMTFERKRTHFNLHQSYFEKVQRLFISLVKGSYVEPHYHQFSHQWEMFIVINGILKVAVYDSTGVVIKELLIGDEQENFAIEIQPNEIHSVECLSDKALILEIKEGPFDPTHAKVLTYF